MVSGHQIQNNKYNEIQPNRGLLISLTVIQTGYAICRELHPVTADKCITRFAYIRKAETKFPCLSHVSLCPTKICICTHKGLCNTGEYKSLARASRNNHIMYLGYQFFIHSYPVDRQVHIMVTSCFFNSLIQQPQKEKLL